MRVSSSHPGSRPGSGRRPQQEFPVYPVIARCASAVPLCRVSGLQAPRAQLRVPHFCSWRKACAMLLYQCNHRKGNGAEEPVIDQLAAATHMQNATNSPGGADFRPFGLLRRRWGRQQEGCRHGGRKTLRGGEWKRATVPGAGGGCAAAAGFAEMGGSRENTAIS